MLARARKSSVDVCDNIRKKLDKIVNEVKVVMMHKNHEDFDLNWRKEFVGKVDANEKFEDKIYNCRYDFIYLEK